MILVLVAGTIAPAGVPSGVERFSGQERDHAAEALLMSHAFFDNPIEKLWIRGRSVHAIRPLALHERWGWEPRPCAYEVRVRTYGPFWLPYSSALYRCGSILRSD